MSWEKTIRSTLLFLLASTATVLAKPLLIVATFPLNADWVGQITDGSDCELVVLANNEQDVHTFDPGPRQAVALTKADMVVEIGNGFEPWMDDLLTATSFNGKRVSLSRFSPTQAAHTCEIEGHEHNDNHHDHAHTDPKSAEHDPHFWTNPQNVIEVVEKLTDTLCEIDPENAPLYRENFDKYAEELQALDAYAAQTFGAIPADRKVIITHHGNLYHFAARYDLHIPATLLGSFSTEGSEPSARQIVAIIELIDEEYVQAVFTESTVSPRLAEQVCRQAKLPPPPVLYIEAFSSQPDGPQNYTAQLRYTVDTIAQAIQTQP